MNPVMWFSTEVSEHITPVIRDFLIDVYEHPETHLDPEAKDSSSNQLIKFQLAIKKVPNWTNTQIKKQIDNINTRCPGFKKLLVALFMAYINMLSNGIRTSSKSRRLDVKLPSDETFVHTCFVMSAHDMYEDPYVMKKSERERVEELDKRIQKCVLKTIHKLIPTTDIINNFIPAMGDDVSFGADDDEGPSAAEMAAEATSVPASAPASVPAPEGAVPAEKLKEEEEEDEEDDEEGGEPKTIQVPKSNPQPELFPDAPDKISSSQ